MDVNQPLHHRTEPELKAPRLPPPQDAYRTINRSKKRLIVLCDGTLVDSLADSVQFPSNITRLSRAVSPNAWILVPGGKESKKVYEEVEQIVAYLPGPGTTGGGLMGAAFGSGLSETIRLAYGFLCLNFNTGDKIHIFGFSRGAYIARSLAHLVAEHGLLSKRGLDNFNVVYQSFYSENAVEDDCESNRNYRKKLVPTPEELGLFTLPRGTVEVLALFDSVGFHNPLLPLFNAILGSLASTGGDKNEMSNTLLSEKVRYVFHALALDESRVPFATNLLFKPKHPRTAGDWETELKQMWFSGAQYVFPQYPNPSDIGGGMKDPRLSNIPLMWMISELVSRNLLEFDENYLLNEARSHKDQWATAFGKNFCVPKNIAGIMIWACTPVMSTMKTVVVMAIKHVFRGHSLSRTMSGVRTPGLYTPINSRGENLDPEQFDTNEEFHVSLKDRDLKKWPCKPLTFLGSPQGKYSERTVPPRKSEDKPVAASRSILQRPAHTIELRYRGRLRDAVKPPYRTTREKEIVPVRAKPDPTSADVENPFKSAASSLNEEWHPNK